MNNKEKLSTFGKYSFVMLFALSVLLNVKQALDINLSKAEKDLLKKALEDKKLLRNKDVSKDEARKKMFGFDMDPTTNEIILKKFQSERFNTK